MPVDKCKFGVFKGITVHMLYYYYDYYHHRRFVFGFLLKSHIWEREESRQSADRFCSQQHKRERDCSDELHEHVRHLTCSLRSECFHLVTTPSAARCEQKLQPWSFCLCSHQTPFKKTWILSCRTPELLLHCSFSLSVSLCCCVTSVF